VAAKGVRVLVMRLPQGPHPVKQGLVTYLIACGTREGCLGVCRRRAQPLARGARPRWPPRLYRLALEKGSEKGAGGARYNAVAEEGVPLREIAEAIGGGLKGAVVSKSAEEAGEHFGWLGMFRGRDAPASSALTQERLGWRPTVLG